MNLVTKGIFLKKFKNRNFQNKLISDGDKIIIGVSGGPDSTALVLLLKEFSKKNKLFLHLVHVNYGLRGEDSEKDEFFVRELASENELTLDVLKYKDGESKKGNLEENLRNFRYKEFERIREEREFSSIAVGHTLDDRVETILMNIIRGAGLGGLVSLKNKNNFIIRPLLNFEKKELVDFLEAQSQSYRLDRSNLDVTFLRNKIRSELIPLLQKQYNPQIKKSILNLSDNSTPQVKGLDEMTNYCYNRMVKQQRDVLAIDIFDIEELPKFMLKNIFRKVILELSGNLRNIGSSNFTEFNKIICSRKNKSQKMIFRKIEVIRRGNVVYFKKVSK